MTIEWSIIYLSMFIWLLPPFRNVGTKYFFFFFVFAIEDPLAVFVLKKIHLFHNMLFPLFTLFILYSLVNKKNKRILLIVTAVYLSYIILSSDTNSQLGFFLNSILHVYIFVLFVSDFLTYFDEHHSVNLFLTLLVCYEFIAVSKNILWILDLSKGIVIFFVSLFIQIFLGIAFTIWNVNNSPKFKIKGMDL